MDRNTVALNRFASQIARNGETISKALARRTMKGHKFDKDGGNAEKRVDQVVNMARRFRLLRDARAMRRQIQTTEPLAQRLEQHKRRKFLQCVAQANFRTATAGDHSTFVHFVNEADRVKALAVSMEGFRYSKNSPWRRTDTEHRYYVHRLWGTRVYKAGLAVLDGLLTLDAGPAETTATPDGRKAALYQALWVGQGQGFSLTTYRGYIATTTGLFYHATTAEAAILGLASRKKVEAEWPPKRLPKFDLAENLFGETAIEPADWLRAGVSESVLEGWCCRVGLECHDSLTLQDVIKGYRLQSSLPVLQVIRGVLERCGKQGNDF